MANENMYFIFIDKIGRTHIRVNTIKEEYPSQRLIVLNSWTNEDKNYNLPTRLLPRMEYAIFPKRSIETMTTNIRMFGRDKKMLVKKWNRELTKRLNKAKELQNKFMELAQTVFDDDNTGGD